MQVTVRIKGLERVRKLLDPKKVDRATVSTLNRVIRSTKTKASTLIRKEKGWKIKKRDFDKRIEIKKARRGDLEAVLSVRRISAATGRRTGKESFALTYFGAKEIRKTASGVLLRQRGRQGLITKKQKRSKRAGGVTVQVLRGGRVAHYPRAFIARMKSGHVGVFRHVTVNGRQKIREIRTISVATMFRGTLPALQAHARERWRKEFPAQLRHQLSKGR